MICVKKSFRVARAAAKARKFYTLSYLLIQFFILRSEI
ncbi:hypothetical protein CAMSH0001_1978 [Campylobacter showae RM3277]|uniref:Uncharacterized protein n=1 Tax=Campylobacter showae RM3277 TaxID=553219 RepID=C6RE86_9BACT|nr:hypothetical protein CAMSH0001_1978 [Campylobacter showae RM3277]